MAAMNTFSKADAESLKVVDEEGKPRGCWRREGVRNLALTLSCCDSVFPSVKWDHSSRKTRGGDLTYRLIMVDAK